MYLRYLRYTGKPPSSEPRKESVFGCVLPRRKDMSMTGNDDAFRYTQRRAREEAERRQREHDEYVRQRAREDEERRQREQRAREEQVRQQQADAQRRWQEAMWAQQQRNR